MMNQKEIWKKLDNLYDNKKSQKFIDHLIKSYLPKNKIEKIVEKPKGRFRCALTNYNLVAIEDVFDEIGDDSKKKNKFGNFINNIFSDEPVNPPKLNILKRKSIALTGEKTDTFLRYETFIAFFKWVQNKIIEGDKHIYWLIKQIQAEEDFEIKRTVDNGKEKIEFVKNNDRKKATFGDLDELHELKAKLKEQERK